MDHAFWHQRWQNQQIGFHLGAVNPWLARYFQTLQLTPGHRVFVPLCGKTLDIPWLLAQGHRVVAVELSELAVEALFASLDLLPAVTQRGPLKHFHAAQIEVFQGDFFALNEALLGKVDAIYDRAALIALPAQMRQSYSRHLMDITHRAPQLLISFAYDQSLLAGPPFSVNATEVHAHYAADYQLEQLATQSLEKGLKGQYPAEETVWLLSH